MKYIKKYENTKYYKDQLNAKLIKYSSNISSLQVIKELLEKGADINHKDVLGNTPLIEASKALFYNGMEFLLNNGADPNITNNYNETGLITISQYPNHTIKNQKNKIYKIIDLFIEYGIDLNIKSIGRGYVNNYTALDYNDIIKDYIEEKHPNAYKEYLFKKEVEKYNI